LFAGEDTFARVEFGEGTALQNGFASSRANPWRSILRKA